MPKRLWPVVILAAIWGSSAAQAFDGSVAVVAVVAPARLVVVDGQYQITEIYSNTAAAVQPTVRLETASGPTTNYTPLLQHQLQAILATVDITRTGLIYRSDRDTATALHRWLYGG